MRSADQTIFAEQQISYLQLERVLISKSHTATRTGRAVGTGYV